MLSETTLFHSEQFGRRKSATCDHDLDMVRTKNISHERQSGIELLTFSCLSILSPYHYFRQTAYSSISKEFGAGYKQNLQDSHGSSLIRVWYSHVS